MNLKSKDIAAVASYYEEERIRLASKLKHVDSILRKISGANTDLETGVILTKQGEQAKKRGPKSIWGKFILEQLKQRQQPLSYKDLMVEAMKSRSEQNPKYQNVRSSILNSAFRLRAIQGKIATVQQEGKKEKFIVLRSWVDDKGGLSKSHRQWLKKHRDFVASPVDLSSLPSPKYAEDLSID